MIPGGIEVNQFVKLRDGPLIPVILYSAKHFLIKTLAFIVFLSESGFTLASKILVKTNDYSTAVVYEEIVNQTNVSFLKTIFSALQHMLHDSNELSGKRYMEVSKLIFDFAEKKKTLLVSLFIGRVFTITCPSNSGNTNEAVFGGDISQIKFHLTLQAIGL